MAGVEHRSVAAEDSDSRLDRWFKRHFPSLSHGRLEKLLRTGQVRVDGKRVKASQRLTAGQTIRVPPLGDAPAPSAGPGPVPARPRNDRDAAEIRKLVLHEDPSVLVLDKPAGLAVQGGSKLGGRHLDAMLHALAGPGGERPRLVHRLDRDTSGVLLLGRTAAAARALTAAFRGKSARKLYWAVVVGQPNPPIGRIDLPLAKVSGGRGQVVAPDDEDGKRAVTDYRVIEDVGKRAAWLALSPVTGRTHQLRVHMAGLGTPILGDGKYGGAQAFLTGAEIARQVHLHARRICLPHPDGGMLDVTAPLSAHMAGTWRYLGFSARGPETDLLTEDWA